MMGESQRRRIKLTKTENIQLFANEGLLQCMVFGSEKKGGKERESNYQLSVAEERVTRACLRLIVHIAARREPGPFENFFCQRGGEGKTMINSLSKQAMRKGRGELAKRR